MGDKNIDISENPYLIRKSVSLKEALKEISANQRGQIAVVNEEMKLVGVLSDGDIRRSLLRESSLMTPVEEIMNVDYIACRKESDRTPEETFEEFEDIMILPVINKNNKVVEVIPREAR